MSIKHHFDQSPRLLPRTIEDVLSAWTVRGAGLALVLAAAAISVAMLTWSSNDPSLSLNTSEPARNLLGSPGASIADFFFHALGLSVVFFIVPPMVLGMQLLLGERIADRGRRLMLMAASTIAIAGGCSALPVTEGWAFELGFGGIIGDFTYSIAASLLAQVAPGTAGTIAGVMLFALGFWAFSRAICLDQYGVLSLRWPGLRRPDGGQTDGGQTDGGRAGARSARAGGHGRYARLWQKPGRGRDGASLRGRAAAHSHGTNIEPSLTHAPRGMVAEPKPPEWSLDARLADYVAGTAAHETRTGHQDGEAAWHDIETGETMAARLSPAGSMAVEQPVMMLGDDAAEGADDLPAVLKRARQELGELIPQGIKLQAPGNHTAPRAAQPLAQPSGRATDVLFDVEMATTGAADGPKVIASGYRRPSLNLLKAQKRNGPSADLAPSVLQGRARILEDVLKDFRISGAIKNVSPGPVITLFELEPARGTKSSRVVALSDDVARSMSAASARIAVVPGRNAIGIELPNTRRETFGLRELIDTQQFLDSGAKLPLVLGKGIGGEPVLTDLARMPHLLVAGTTGSGKSVGINAMILSLIYRLGPEDCRFLMIDPKMLELSAYNGIPHLLTPVITDPTKAITALAWAVGEMEERYKKMAELGVRSIDAFNNRVRHAARSRETLGRMVQTGFDPATGEAVFEHQNFDAKPLPYIVIVVDEFADLMAVAGKEIEGLVQRLAQMARAAGLHLIMATQRPSVDVVTGTIKANFPTRISYRVASRIDSRTILNEQGGEQLLGQGDMLLLDGSGALQRVHGPFVSDEEVEAVTNALRDAYPPNYCDDVLRSDEEIGQPQRTGGPAGDLYQRAIDIVRTDKKASTSYLQRRLGIGYNRAADLIERMEADGIISPADHAGRRDILLAG